jgi:uncharacterized delta-60 repeat protein
MQPTRVRLSSKRAIGCLADFWNSLLDPSFNNGSPVLTAVRPPNAKYYNDLGWAAAIYPNTGTFSDKIYVAGWSQDASRSSNPIYFTLIRYNSNGSLDTTFGSGGIVVTPSFGSGTATSDHARALTIQPADGKIILAGYVNTQGSLGGPVLMAVARYLPSGALDSSTADASSPFGTSGIVMISAPGATQSQAWGVALQSSQHNAIVVCGDSYFSTGGTAELTLARLTSGGQLDASFGGSGTGFAVNSTIGIGRVVTSDPNGDLLVTGPIPTPASQPQSQAIAAYLPGGTPDTTFGTGGITTAANFDGGYLTIQPGDGKLIATGVTSDNHNALARFLPPNTKIGSFTASQATAGGTMTLTASNILDSNPTSAITQVAFYYLDNNNTAVLLGYGTLNTSTGAWSLATSSLASGTTYNLMALATDSNGAVSDPITISFTVM